MLTFPEMCERAGSLHARVEHQRIVLVVVYSCTATQRARQQQQAGLSRKAHGHSIDSLSLKNLITDLKFSVTSNYEVRLPGASLFDVVKVLKKFGPGGRERRELTRRESTVWDRTEVDSI